MENGKKISKAIGAISKIACVISIIGISLMVIIGIALPFIINNSNLLEQLEIVENKGLLTIDVNDEKNVSVKYVLDNYSKTEIVIIGELYVIIGIVSLSLLYLTFNNVHKLFRNIENGSTPFTEDNIKLLKNITNKTMLYIIVPSILMIILELIVGFGIDNSISLSSIIIVMILYAIGYVFEYGHKLQIEADETL